MVPSDDCCGDHVLDEFEECDAYMFPAFNMDDSECTTKCKLATCGDGFAQANVEACDGEEWCTEECTISTCGDATVDPWEDCEPARPGDPECSALCTDARKVVFFTSTFYKGGELGGLVGADAKCQAAADAAGLPGLFEAILCTSEADAPREKFWSPVAPFWPKVPHVTTAGTFVFEWPELDLASPLLDEFGNPHPGGLISFSNSDKWGWFAFECYDWVQTCDDWTNTSAMGAAITLSWSSDSDGAPCSVAAPIICVEQ